MDAAAMDKYGIPGVILMENAGVAVADAVSKMLACCPCARVLIVCGKGNNGGDGLVAARHLQNRGADVHVALLASGSDLTGDAAINFRIASGMGVPLTENADGPAVRALLARADIVVDAILGTGTSGEVRGVAREAIEAINARGARVVAADIPSGIHADTGAVLGAAVQAQATVTFGLPKLGLVQYPGRAHCGELRVADISLPRALLTTELLKAQWVTGELARELLPLRASDMHKGDAGRALVVAGAPGMTGAAALCGAAALRAGAGLVTVACAVGLQDVIAAKCLEVMTLGLPQTAERTLGSEAREPLLQIAGRSDAVAMGPGLSQHPETAALVREVVAALDAPLVLDADGLNALNGDLAPVKGRTAPTVLTPHPGELARLCGQTIESIQQDRVDAARRAAAACGAVLVLKGAATVTAEPGGRVWVNATGNSGMASGGMGDLLTGIIAAFLAGGADPLAAAVAGVHYHGRAADLAAENDPRSLIASDVLRALPGALADG